MKAILAMLLFCLCSLARADSCTATLSNLSFGNVSPITGSDVTATATGNVSCSWNLLAATPPFLLLFPNALVCVNIGIDANSTSGNPRALGNGSNRMQYNLYRDTTYATASIWGATGVASAPTPYAMTLTAPNLIIGGTINQSFTVYGKIPAGASLAAVPTSGNGNTVYSSSFTGVATISYGFYNLIAPTCATASGSSSFTFTVSATAINDCTISAGGVGFGTSGVLTGPVRAQGTITVKCVNNDAYQIALNGGTTSGSVAGRQMKPTTGAGRINYQLSQSLDGPIWGDGTGGTTVYSNTGTGASLGIQVYGRVPAQTTPAPGDYKDTVTATVIF